MQILTRLNKVIAYSEHEYIPVGNSAVCPTSGECHNDALITTVDYVPTDIDKFEYYYIGGKFIKGSANPEPLNTTLKGKNITLRNVVENPLTNLVVYGETTQFTTTGKNKLPMNNYVQTLNGVTFTCNKYEGTVTVNGTATATASFCLTGGLGLLPLESGAYTLSGCPTGGGNSKYQLVVNTFDADSNDTGRLRDNGSGASLIFNEDVSFNAFIYVTVGCTVNNLVFKPMLRESSTDATHEIYTGGMASPNPDYPQDLVSIGDNGSFEVGVYGKNLYQNKASTTTTKGVTFTINNDGSVTVNGTATALAQINLGTVRIPKGKYKATGFDGSVGGIQFHIKASTDTGWPLVVGEKDLTYTEDVNVFFIISIGEGVTVTNLTFYPMLRLATETDNTYEPCNKQTLTMTYNPLRIPVLVDHNYIDANGQKYIRDEIDFNKGIFNSRIIKIVLNGSETYTLKSNGVIQGALSGVKGNWAKYLALSTHFTYNPTMINSGEAGYFAIDGGGGIQLTTDFTTVEEFKTWLQSNNVTIYAVRRTPIEIPLTKNELNAYYKLHTNHPTTTITSEADMEVTVTRAQIPRYQQDACGIDLLWENASPSSAFAGQTVNLNLKGYAFVIIECLNFNSSNPTNNCIVEVGKTSDISAVTGVGKVRLRNVEVTTSGATFGGGQIIDIAVTQLTNDNNIQVPIKIYGIKGVV
jgi:hypothetical protein